MPYLSERLIEKTDFNIIYTLKPQSQKTSQSDHMLALSNSTKLRHAMWGHPRWSGHGGED